MSAGLFEDPENPTEEEMTSNAAVSVAPVAEQADWIRAIIGDDAKSGDQKEDSSEPAAAASSEDSGNTARNVGIGAGVVVLAAAGAWLLLRRRDA